MSVSLVRREGLEKSLEISDALLSLITEKVKSFVEGLFLNARGELSISSLEGNEIFKLRIQCRNFRHLSSAFDWHEAKEIRKDAFVMGALYQEISSIDLNNLDGDLDFKERQVLVGEVRSIGGLTCIYELKMSLGKNKDPNKIQQSIQEIVECRFQAIADQELQKVRRKLVEEVSFSIVTLTLAAIAAWSYFSNR